MRMAHSILKSLVIIVLSTLLTQCLSYDSRHHQYQNSQKAIFEKVDNSKVQSFVINPNKSHVVLKIYKQGKLANFGHNHVITVKGLQGIFYLNKQNEKSMAKMQFSVADLVVDDANERKLAGQDFDKLVSDTDKEATRNNLLGEKQLKANKFPIVELEVNHLTAEISDKKVQFEQGKNFAIEAQLRIRMLGEDYQQMIKSKVTLDGSHLKVQGDFVLNQTDVGIIPFSLFSGAIAVVDAVKIEFEIEAEK